MMVALGSAKDGGVYIFYTRHRQVGVAESGSFDSVAPAHFSQAKSCL